MWKLISLLIEVALIGYMFYLGVLKETPTLHDVAFMLAIVCINTFINQGKLERIEAKINR